MEISLDNYILFWICLVGLCFGSFFNVVILRSLSDESIIFPPSKCPKCNNKLKPWHNIPVLSFIFLKGKCAFCNGKISLQYPIVELLTMILFAFSFKKFGISFETLFAIILCSTLIIMTTTDIKAKLVDCNIAIFLAIIGLLYNWLYLSNSLDSIYGLVLGIVIFEILALTGFLFTKSRAFGEADTFVAAALGACFGFQGLLQILIYTLISAMFFIIPTFLYKQFKKQQKLTCTLFVLFIIIAILFKLIWENWLMLFLLALVGILLSINILKNIKNESTLTYFPLVPAFAVGALYYLFFNVI